jgi:hypothetical protein
MWAGATRRDVALSPFAPIAAVQQFNDDLR